MCGERAYEEAHTAREKKPRRDDDRWTGDFRLNHLPDRSVSGPPTRATRLSPQELRELRDGSGWIR